MKIEEMEYNEHEAALRTLIQKGDPVDFQDLFLSLHPGEQADHFIELDQHERAFVYRTISPEVFTDLFEKLTLE